MTRFGYFMVTYLMMLFVVITWIFRPSPHLLWNASPSVPTGLYALASIDTLKRGDLIAARPPASLARYMAIRHYLPLGLPLIKHVGALPGQTVCRRAGAVSIDGQAIATARSSDHLQRPLPAWEGCHFIGPGEIFLLNPDVPDSFDGRYFGVLPIASIMGRTVPLWTSREQFP
jgi:conjugative transfer signal peptidase TraF